jgi:hypothetical protein
LNTTIVIKDRISLSAITKIAKTPFFIFMYGNPATNRMIKDKPKITIDPDIFFDEERGHPLFVDS